MAKKLNTDQPAKWFSLHAEILDDPKVQMLSEVDQRRFIMILCARCRNGNETFHDVSIAFQLRITLEEWLRTKETLIVSKLVTSDNKPTNWDKRQKPRDLSTERVRRHRKRNETFLKQQCNVSETAHSIEENSKEVEEVSSPLNKFKEENTSNKKTKAKKIFEFSEDFLKIYENYPKSPHSKRMLAWKEYQKLIKQGVGHDEICGGVNRYRKYCEATRTDQQYVTGCAKWLAGGGYTEKYDLPEQPFAPKGYTDKRPSGNDLLVETARQNIIKADNARGVQVGREDEVGNIRDCERDEFSGDGGRREIKYHA